MISIIIVFVHSAIEAIIINQVFVFGDKMWKCKEARHRGGENKDKCSDIEFKL